MVLVRRWELMDPPKMSPLDEPGRAPKRFRVTASSENRAAREREEAVGVAGIEMFPVLNLNNPNWCTAVQSKIICLFRIHLSNQNEGNETDWFGRFGLVHDQFERYPLQARRLDHSK